MDHKSIDVLLTRAIAEIQESNLNRRDAQCSPDICSPNAFFDTEMAGLYALLCKLTNQMQNKTNVDYLNGDMSYWSRGM